MAEAQKTPVIVDEEEQNVERTGLAIPLSTEEDDSKTVGEMIEAGEVALPKDERTVDDLPKENGIPRLDIAPVRLKPRPSEKTLKSSVGMPLGEYDVSLSKEGVPSVQFKSLQEDAEASVEKFEQPLETYEGVLEKLEKGEEVVINGQRYSGPNAARLARTPAISRKMQLGIAIDNSLKKKQQSEEQPLTDTTIAFTTPTGEIDVSHLDASVRDEAQTYAEGRKALDDSLRPIIKTDRPDIDKAVRQYFIDDFSTGNRF